MESWNIGEKGIIEKRIKNKMQILQSRFKINVGRNVGYVNITFKDLLFIRVKKFLYLDWRILKSVKLDVIRHYVCCVIKNY